MLDMSKFIEKFKEEAEERLLRLNEDYITYETNPADGDSISRLLREAHTLKGSAKMVGLNNISKLAHKLEDLLVEMKNKKIEPKGENSDLVFQILDSLFLLVEKGNDDDFDLEVLLDSVDEVIFNAKNEKPEELHLRKKEEKKGYEKEKKEKARVPVEKESINEEDSTKDDVKLHQLETIRVKASQVDKILNLVGELVIYHNKTIGRISSVKNYQKVIAQLTELWRQLKSALNTDAVPNLYLKEQVNNVSSTIDKLRESEEEVFGKYIEDASRIDILLQDLHEVSMEIRMLPASYVFSAFPRAVRDLAKEYGKEIELEIEGEETKLDKRILEEINDPLIHILRNSVDHGIETSEEREALGKPRKGKIKLSASQEGDRILVRISDDGRGIDPKKVKLAAVKKGIISQAEADSMSDDEAIYLIFRKGFSTSATVSEVSGRGVGLDVVKFHIEDNLRGHIEVSSITGEGTTFILTLPLTLAIIRALMVTCGKQTFAIPTTNIEETVILKDGNIYSVGEQKVLRLRDRNINLVHLPSLLGVESASSTLERKPAIVVGVAGEKFAYAVDDLVGEQPIVIKSLGSILKKIPNIAGATVLGSGELVLILNVSDLVRNSKTSRSYIPLSSEKKQFLNKETAEKNLKSEKKKKILVVEDSLTTRELEVNILKTAGYEAFGVKDGLEAIEALSGDYYDLVLTDVQMPRMNGFELIKKLRSDKRYDNLPVVIVSSLGSDEDRLKGLEIGADGYFVKRHFDQGSLLDLVGRLVG